MAIQIWRHATSGDRYAVQLSGDEIVAVAGPLSDGDMEAARAGDFDGDPEDREWLDENRDEFRLVEAAQ